ncbi:MAG: hypothetical protein ABIY37_14770 [Devosia sp.]
MLVEARGRERIPVYSVQEGDADAAVVGSIASVRLFYHCLDDPTEKHDGDNGDGIVVALTSLAAGLVQDVERGSQRLTDLHLAAVDRKLQCTFLGFPEVGRTDVEDVAGIKQPTLVEYLNAHALPRHPLRGVPDS